ncbi:MAG TPA: FHA domain-containing protein [Haliangiales bacterium]|nr:FHA domain-containing protein [Haliangiales bacterium]
MGFLSRLLSGDFRRAVAAEAAGDYAEAARHYALAGDRDKVAVMHLLRAGRAATNADEIDCLRDAIRWADAGTPTRRRVARALGQALLKRVKQSGGERERAIVEEAAEQLLAAEDYAAAGDAWALIGDDAQAARAYEQGGLLEQMEEALQRDGRKRGAARELKGAFKDYELHMKGGEREAAVAALRRAVDAAEQKAEYQRLLDDLLARRLAAGAVALRGKGPPLHVCEVPTVTIGRSPDCTLPLRAASVSRVHATIATPEYVLRDAGSRAGTLIGGMPLAGEVRLVDAGRFALGDECEIAWKAGEALELVVVKGLDRGLMLIHAADGRRVSLAPRLGLPAAVWFRDGRPYVEADAERTVHLNGERARGAVQLVRQDVLRSDDVEVEVA